MARGTWHKEDKVEDRHLCWLDIVESVKAQNKVWLKLRHWIPEVKLFGTLLR